MIKSKIKASLIHLLLGIVIVSFSISMVIYFWYPTDYLGITNFKNIATIIVIIDLVLGPMLTFVVYKPRKKGLKFDLSIIALVQLSALIYGVNILYKNHPLFITYNHGSFNLIHANQVNPAAAKLEKFKISKFSSPKLAFAVMPSDPDEQTKIMIGVDLMGEPDIDKRPEYFEPVKNHLDIIISSSLKTAELFEEKRLTADADMFLKKYGNKKDQFAYLPLKGINGNAVIVIDKESGELITTIDIDPWNLAKK